MNINKVVINKVVSKQIEEKINIQWGGIRDKRGFVSRNQELSTYAPRSISTCLPVTNPRANDSRREQQIPWWTAKDDVGRNPSAACP